MMNYETVDHISWECSRFEDERRQLLLGLAAVNIKEGTPIRDGSQWCNGLRHAFNISPLRSQVQSPVLALII
jgi:hypothetical protein